MPTHRSGAPCASAWRARSRKRSQLRKPGSGSRPGTARAGSVLMIDLLGQAAHGLLLAVLLLHCVLAGSFTWILVQYLRYRRAGLQEEARLLAEPLPPDSELPDVLVQIPTYNEGDLVMRVAAAVASLDWPRDKLHVQVLDDSTDRSSIAFAEQAVNRMTRDGNDAKLLRRPHRHGFKAGAVGEGLHVSNA